LIGKWHGDPTMALRSEVPILIAQSGPVAGQRWTLGKAELTIGRGAECDIMIPDRQVSRVHARLRQREDGGFELEDLQSKNGTHINGAPLHGTQRLQDGDFIQVALVAKLIYVGSEATMPLRMEAESDAAPAPPASTPFDFASPRGAGGERSTSVQNAPPGALRLDIAGRRAWIGEREVDPALSVPQFRFLELLYQRAGQVCTREEIIKVVWPEAIGSDGVSEQAIDALARRLRDRLSELDSDHQYIVTVRGHGFRLENRSY
jgi:hypothetical protein